MKKERKLGLLRVFPPVPGKIMAKMGEKKKVAQNFVVFLTKGDELFARCYHQYYDGRVAERQRYVFAKDGCCRYGVNNRGEWAVRTEIREPVFTVSYGYNFDNSYTVLNTDAIYRSCMRYSCANLYGGNLLISYLALYTKHPNIEYLMKSGYGQLIYEEDDRSYYWAAPSKLFVNSNVNLKSNDLLKMLRLNRTEFKTLSGSELLYNSYIMWRENFPKLKPAELFNMAKAFGSEYGTMCRVVENTGLKPVRIAAYIAGQNVPLRDYLDYIGQCRDLRYNLRDTAISMPHDFRAMHERLSNIIEYMHDGETNELFAQNYEPRRVLEFSSGKYIIRQPLSVDEITDEGKALKHCVGGYAKRHAEGKLTILFIRKADKPETPLYTLELSNSGKIVQVRGMHNRAPTKEVEAFIERYKQYIFEIFSEKARITA